MTAPSKLTVSDYMTQWLTTTTPRLRASTVAQYEILIRVHISPALGSLKLTALRPVNLQQLYAGILAKGRSPRRAEQAHRVLHKALGDAVRLRLLPHNPAQDVDAPNGKAPERDIWSPAEVRLFIEASVSSATLYDPLWLFLLGSGCRVGEALGLRWGDVDWTAKSVLIERAVVHVKNVPMVGPPKTRSGRRRITLPAFALAALRHQQARGGVSPDGGTTGAIFRNSKDGVPQPTDLRRRFHEAAARAGLPLMRIHDLRAAHATMLVAAGVDVKTVQRRLGHASLALTLGLYAKVVQSGDGLAAEAMDSLAPGSTLECI
ncbi:MAG: tyrosine-type recombinase/integrase [Chloroflexota bacterium]